MGETVCKGCGGVIDFTGIEPFTLCECSDCGTDIVIPLEMDFFKLERKLKSIACFDVYEGFDMSNNMDVVVYIFDKKEAGAQVGQILSMAKKEASNLETLKHANICPLLSAGEVQGRFYVSEPKMDGFPLSDYVPDDQSELDVGKVIDVLQAATVGLAVAHHKEFSHHNINPKTLHIDARGNVRLKGFYISRFRYLYEEFNGTPSTVIPYFISPEKAETGKEDKRGDVFSFGVLFYYMLTGRYPFSGETKIETIYSRVKRKEESKEDVFSESSHRMITKDTVKYVPPVLLSELRPEVEAKLVNMIMRMLDPQPFKRPILPEILDSLQIYQAKMDQEREVVAAQKTMVTTVTRAIPKMAPITGAHKRPKKRRFFK